MKKRMIASIALALMLPAASYATEKLICQSENDSYQIEIASKTISIKKMGFSDPRTLWNIDDPGIYSFFATSVNVPSNGARRTLDVVRFDIDGQRKLNTIVANSRFRMRITFGWWELETDQSGNYSDKQYNCTKLE